MLNNAVAHLTSVHPRYDIRIFLKECRSLASSGHQVTLVVADGKGDEIKDDIHIFDVGTSVGRLDRFRNTTKRVFNKASELNADIYHFHDPELLPVGLLLRLHGKRVIYDVHEDLPQQIKSKSWLPSWLRTPISFFAEIFERVSAVFLSGVVTVTPTIARRFPKSKTVLVCNYPVVTLNEVNAYSSRPNHIAYAGGIAAIRGAREMVQAMDKIADPSVKLLLAGRFSSEKFEQELKSIKGWSQAEYLGWLDRAQISERLYGTSKIGLVVLHPIINYRVAYPIKLFEYMSAGLPVVASDFPLWRSIIDNARCGLLVDPLDSDAIANAICWLLEHPDDAAAMGERGRNAVSEKYNWAHEEKKLLEFYTKVLQ